MNSRVGLIHGTTRYKTTPNESDSKVLEIFRIVRSFDRVEFEEFDLKSLMMEADMFSGVIIGS